MGDVPDARCRITRDEKDERRVERLALHTVRVLLDEFCSQATEGQWGMPGHTEARKGAVSCDKPGGAAHRL